MEADERGRHGRTNLEFTNRGKRCCMSWGRHRACVRCNGGDAARRGVDEKLQKSAFSPRAFGPVITGDGDRERRHERVSYKACLIK